MRRTVKIFLLLAAALCLAAGPALAHDMWLTVDKPVKGKPAHIVAGYGHAFPANEGTDKDMLVPAYLVGPKGKVETTPGKALDWVSKTSLKKGSYVAVSGRKAQFWTKTPEGYKHKTKDQVPEAIRCLRSAKFAKAIINVGKNCTSVTKPVGQTLEVVPLANPGAVKKGGELGVQVLFQGKPLAKAEVFGTYAGYSKHKNTFAFYGKTDKEGKTYLRLAHSGTWLLVAKHKMPYPDQAKCDQDAYSAALTFTVK